MKLFNHIHNQREMDIWDAVTRTFHDGFGTLARVDVVIFFRDKNGIHQRAIRLGQPDIRPWGLTSVCCPECQVPIPGFEVEQRTGRAKCWTCLWAVPSFVLKQPDWVHTITDRVFWVEYPIVDEHAKTQAWVCAAQKSWYEDNPVAVEVWRGSASYRMHIQQMEAIQQFQATMTHPQGSKQWPLVDSERRKDWERARVEAGHEVSRALHGDQSKRKRKMCVARCFVVSSMLTFPLFVAPKRLQCAIYNNL